jgi:hypothetical protein
MFYSAVGQSMAEVPSWNVTVSTTEQMARGQSFSVLAEPRCDMTVGRTYYRFVRPTVVNYIPSAEGWVCYVSGLGGQLGGGDTPEGAFEELKVQIHTVFQTLLEKRPFEMSEDEHSQWVQLTSIIDLLYYKTTTPLTTHEIGQVSFGMVNRPHHIEWINGKVDRIRPERSPGDLMSCVPSQWIEAVVRRDPLSFEILEIESIRKIRFRKPNESQLRAAWDNMPEAKLDSAEWVW